MPPPSPPPPSPLPPLTETCICPCVSTMESHVSAMFKFTDYYFFILCIPIYKAGWSRYWGMVSSKLSCPRTQHNHSGSAGTHSSLKTVQKDHHWAMQARYHQLSVKTITWFCFTLIGKLIQFIFNRLFCCPTFPKILSLSTNGSGMLLSWQTF